ncbi:MAG: 50S ribosomal protein L32 [Armatimonadota bacterium]|nr:50S ribosomal protein L32 [Armatimonadota bacterium]MDR7506032.1 50S ribosomal protein L32 [Armatimonadota bacterium]
MRGPAGARRRRMMWSCRPDARRRVSDARGGTAVGIQKRRRSRMHGRQRRAHWTVRAVSLVPCPTCRQPMRPHRVCPSCGTYAGRQVRPVREAEAE